MIHVAIFDTNLQDREQLRRVVISFMELKEEHYELSVFDTLEAIRNYPYPLNIILLDTTYEGTDGIELGKFLLKKHPNPKMIYITQEVEKCNQAINVAHAFAYLKKPLVPEHLTQQLEEACKHLKEAPCTIPDTSILTFSVLPEDVPARKLNTYPKDFYIEDIYYFEFEGRSVKCVCATGEYLLFRGKLCEIIEQTKEHHFIYCHKAYIVNLAYVSSIQEHKVHLKNGTYLPLAQRRTSQFRRQYRDYIYRKNSLRNKPFNTSHLC